jgi:hypothetical protein
LLTVIKKERKDLFWEKSAKRDRIQLKKVGVTDLGLTMQLFLAFQTLSNGACRQQGEVIGVLIFFTRIT